MRLRDRPTEKKKNRKSAHAYARRTDAISRKKFICSLKKKKEKNKMFDVYNS